MSLTLKLAQAPLVALQNPPRADLPRPLHSLEGRRRCAVFIPCGSSSLETLESVGDVPELTRAQPVAG